MSLVGGTLGKIGAVLLAGLVVSAAGVGAAVSTGVVSLQPPAVESVENEWGEVTKDETQIRTTVVMDNPNKVGVPGAASVTYDVTMNDVTMAEGSSGGLSLSPGRNEIALKTGIDNEKIPAWWASHINNGEETTLSVEPSAKVAFVSKGLPSFDRTFETDMLSSFDSQSGQSVQVGNRTLLTVEETEASWGHATEDETPLRFAGTVHNPNSAPITFSKIGYEVSMNDVTVAEGTTEGGVEISANSTDTIRINSTLDNGKLDEWWVSHLNRGERTDLNVSVFAVVEGEEGTQRVPLPFLSQRVAFETDILGGGTATTRALGPPGEEKGLGASPPRVVSIDRDWAATDSGTRFTTTVVVDNPNAADSHLGNVSLDATYRVRLNGMTLIQDSQETTLTPGRSELTVSKGVSDAAIQRWWMSHVRNGERTKLTTEGRALADLGFAEVPVPLPKQHQTFETDMLSGLRTGSETVTVRGRTLAKLHGVSAEWGEPTMKRTPIAIDGKVTNERDGELTVKRLGYEIEANGVVLADDETNVGTTIPGKSTRAISATAGLDNQRIDDWWVSHLTNGEESDLSVSYYAVVEYRGNQFTVELDSMSYEKTIETSAFGST
ncbi:LEA type 2 family protein [Halorussus ruber]|uniref:LEA type 2 family protein n=1 Tax=Halorussus ruber TaxID=1126238 RepID=UPI0010929CC3|nr:LEA type 2 family protein [Halorussus ruber]